MFKSGFPTKDAASRAVRAAIEECEARHGKVSRDIDSRGRRVWTTSFGDVYESGFETKYQAELALQKALASDDAEKVKRAEDVAKSAAPPVR